MFQWFRQRFGKSKQKTRQRGEREFEGDLVVERNRAQQVSSDSLRSLLKTLKTTIADAEQIAASIKMRAQTEAETEAARIIDKAKQGADEKGKAMNPQKLMFATVAIALTLSLLVPTSVLAQTPPTVTTDNATNITISSATISGNLTSLGTATTVDVFFEYGITTSYGSTTTAQAMMATGLFSSNLTGLSTGTLYHFRANAIGANGVAQGADVPFTTVAIPPVVSTTDNATDITFNSATLKGNLTSLGSATIVNVSFEYGTTISYGSTTTTQSMTGTGAFGANIIGLSPGTLYHFQAKADGGAHGTAIGADMTFTTLTPAPPVVRSCQ